MYAFASTLNPLKAYNRGVEPLSGFPLSLNPPAVTVLQTIEIKELGVALFKFTESLVVRIAEGLVAPTMDAVNVTYGLDTNGCLLPWSQWTAGPGVNVRTTLAEVEQAYPSGDTG
jgi:hypothetical protein